MKTRVKLQKTWVVLGIALAIGVLAALAARSYLATQIDAIEARGRGKTVKVLVASRELRRGEKLGTDAVAVRAIPVDYAHSSAITPEAFDRVDGQTLAYAVKPGEMILWGLMESKRAPTFSARVALGHRAMTVAVDEINSISGMLEPGDLIDLLITLDQRGRKVSRPLLQNVQVMATGQQAVDSPRAGERRQYSTVTIDITPEQANQVILAREAGKVTALLRNPDDKNRLSSSNLDVVSLLGSAPRPPMIDTGIPVLYGGGSRLTPDALAMGKAVRASQNEFGSDDTTPVLQAPPALAPAAYAAGALGGVVDAIRAARR